VASPVSKPAQDLTKATADSCPYARAGVAFYRGRYVRHQLAREAALPTWRKPRNCADARYLANVWIMRAYRARLATQAHLQKMRARSLRDFAYEEGGRAWHRSVREAQKVYPGTDSWLMSCSDAEGGHGRWVGYAGVAYSTGLRDSNTVGGNMQFRFGTFVGMWRASYQHLRSRGYILPQHLRDWNSLEGLTTAWRSALGQALAAGWARYTGNDNSHWSASWNNGCR
jgi:hypothetical protein